MFYVSRGNIPPTRHTQHRAPDGSLYAEELFGVLTELRLDEPSEIRRRTARLRLRSRSEDRAPDYENTHTGYRSTHAAFLQLPLQ